MLNKSTGNMYKWTRTVNPLAGVCPHNCNYCFVRKSKRLSSMLKYQGPPRLWPKAMTSWGKGKTIFLCSCNDLFANGVPDGDIGAILNHACKYYANRYLIQTKNPARLYNFLQFLPPKVIIATTLESNNHIPGSLAPPPHQRQTSMINITDTPELYPTMVSIEPIIEFNLLEFNLMLRTIQPDFVSIGADSQKSGLMEPPRDRILDLITSLVTFTAVGLKPNLRRLITPVPHKFEKLFEAKPGGAND